jgi:hypothetical protein
MSRNHVISSFIFSELTPVTGKHGPTQIQSSIFGDTMISKKIDSLCAISVVGKLLKSGRRTHPFFNSAFYRYLNMS